MTCQHPPVSISRETRDNLVKIFAYGLVPLVATGLATLSFTGLFPNGLFMALPILALGPWCFDEMHPLRRILGYLLTVAVEGLILFILLTLFTKTELPMTNGQRMGLLLFLPLLFTSRFPKVFCDKTVAVEDRLHTAFHEVLQFKGHLIASLSCFLLSGLSHQLFSQNAILALAFGCGCCFVGCVVGIHLATCQKGAFAHGRKSLGDGTCRKLSH